MKVNHKLESQLIGPVSNILSSAIEQSEESVVIMDLTGIVLYANPHFFRSNQRNPDEIIGKNWRSFLPTSATFQEKFAELRDTVLVHGKQWSGEVSDRLRGGELVRREAKVFPIKNEKGEITHIVAISTDVTEFKKVEKALQESERRYRLLIENIPTVAWITSQTGEIKFIGENVEKVSGFTANEILAGGEEFWLNRIHPDDLFRVEDTHERLFTTQMNYRVEYRFQKKNGQWIWILGLANRVDEFDGKRYAYGIYSDISERKQSEEALELYIDRLKIMYQINQGILFTQSPEEIAKVALRWIRPLIPCFRAGITLFDPATTQATLMALDVDGETKITTHTQMQLDKYPGAEVIERLRLGQIVKYDLLPIDYLSKVFFSEGIRTFVYVPILSESELIGSLNLGWRESYDLTGIQQDILREVAAQLSIAIRQAQLQEADKRRRRELELLERISTALRHADKLNDLYTILSEQLKSLFNPDAGAILFPYDHQIEYTLIYGSEKIKEPLSHTREMTEALSPVLLSGKPSFNSGLDFGLQDISSTAFLPFQSQYVHLGGLVLFWSENHEFLEEERRLLNIVADVAGIALHRMKVLEMLEQRIDDRTRALSALYDVTSISIRSLDLQEILDQSLQKVVEAMVSEIGIIHLLDEAGPTLRLASLQCMDPQMVQEGFNRSRGYSLAYEVLYGKKAIVIPELSSDQNASTLESKVIGSPYAGVPIRARDGILGVLSVIGTPGSVYNEEAISLLASIADQIGMVIENAQLNRQAQQAAILSERHRLARDLHDAVTQSLYSVNLMAATGQKMLENDGDKEKIALTLKRLGMTAHQALKEMRLLLYELRPFTLEKVGLVGALRQRLEAVEKRAEIKTQLRADDLPELPSRVEEGLYFIAQEALNNALKHADSKKTEVNIHCDEGWIELEVCDYGKGFMLHDQDQGQGMGLASMKERAAALGGELLITTQPGKGTCVSVRVKVTQGEEKWQDKFPS